MTDSTREVQLADGRRMPIIGLGTWQLRGRTAVTAVRHALDVGYRLIDTATMYGNEAEVGQAVQASGVPREQVFITTKLPPGHAGRERETLLASLRALAVDYIDLWLVHWPPHGQAAPETWSEFISLREEGLVRSIGVSNYSVAQIDELISATGVTPVVNQVKWSPLIYDAERFAQLSERNVVLEGYSPFRAGDLDDPQLVRLAERYAVTPAQIVLRWHVEHGIVVIPKSGTPARIESNFDVFDFALSDDDMASIDALAG